MRIVQKIQKIIDRIYPADPRLTIDAAIARELCRVAGCARLACRRFEETAP